jgi:pimeloyl-ACP methyl ester carboxylesterase
VATFVLIHGSWHGAWCWGKVLPLLEVAGHTVIAPDLPGHGADRTPTTPDLPVRYVPAVVKTLSACFEPAILVGHSSGGMLISAAAQLIPDKVAMLVYLAAFLLPPGITPPMAMRDDRESLLPQALVTDAAEGTVYVRPEWARPVFYADCTEEDARWATARLVPEPSITPAVTQIPRSSSSQEVSVHRPPRVYIETRQDKALGLTAQRRMYETLPCERVYALDTSHSPFLSAPGDLAAHLEDLASGLS